MTASEVEWVRALLEGNARYVDANWDPRIQAMKARPALRLAVVACMDTRHIVEEVLGLQIGEAAVIRNAGSVLDAGGVRSIKVAVYALGVERLVVMGHTDCGMRTLRSTPDLADRVRARAALPAGESSADVAERWGAFDDPRENVRRSVQMLRDDPEVPNDLETVGLLYDNDTGRIEVVVEPTRLASA